MTQPTAIPAAIVVTARRVAGRRGRVEFTTEPEPAPRPRSERRARISEMLALAHHVDAAIQNGRFETGVDAFQRLGLDDSRLYQVLSLRRLAPDIQEDVLFLTAPDGIEPFTEKALRAIARIPDWAEQRQRYAVLRPAFASPASPTV